MWSCGCPWFVRKVGLVPCVVGAVTEMRVLLFVWDVSMLRECDCNGNYGVVAVNAGCDCMGGTRGSGSVSSADDVLDMSVLRGMRGVGGVCEMCMCLARGGVGGYGGEWLYKSCGYRGSVGRVSVFGLQRCG